MTEETAGTPITEDFVEHSYPQYGMGYFCTEDVLAKVAAPTTQRDEAGQAYKTAIREQADQLQGWKDRTEAAEAQRDELQKRIDSAVPVAEGGATRTASGTPKTDALRRKWSMSEGARNSTCSPEAHEIYALCQRLEREVWRLSLPPDETMSDHPGCVYCMEKGTPIRLGMVCPKCGDRLPTKREYELQCQQKVYVVCTGEVVEGRETYTLHDKPPPLSDYEVLLRGSENAG